MGYTDYNAADKNSGILFELSARGCNIETKNGQKFVKIDNLNVPIYPEDNIFTLKNRYIELKKDAIKNENIARYDKEIEEGKAKVKKYSELFDTWMEALKRESRKFLSFLSNNGVSYLSQLKSDSEKYKQGELILSAKNDASSAKNDALYWLLSAAHETGSACCNKIMCLG